MDAARRDVIGRAMGAHVARVEPRHGGSINESAAITFANGSSAFAKWNADAPPGMFEAEKRGLVWLAKTAAVTVPAVLAVGDDFLLLELIRSAEAADDYDEVLGRELATLHRSPAPSFGLDHHNFIGRLPQNNAPAESWAEFYGERRIAPETRRAVDAGRLRPGLARRLDALVASMDSRVGDYERPSRLHGDLWSGNCIVGSKGEPVLVDPAVYGGHREVDLAMMHLFGGFSARVFAAYEEAFPLASGADERVPLYQLYYLLVHVNLFGGAYARAVEDVLDRLG